MHIINNINRGDGDVESMVTNLAIGDVLKIKMKKKKVIRIMNTKTESLMELATTAAKRGI